MSTKETPFPGLAARIAAIIAEPGTERIGCGAPAHTHGDLRQRAYELALEHDADHREIARFLIEGA